jgi:hypothetical protein
VVPLPLKVQEVAPKLPAAPPLLQLTVPVGVAVLPVPVMVAVQFVGWPSPTGFGTQATLVVLPAVMLKLLLVAPVRPELDAVSV